MKKHLLQALTILSIIYFSVNCQNNTSIPKGLRKLSDQELIDRAREGNFPNLDSLVYQNEKGEIITHDSFTKLEPFDSFAFDDYADEKGVVKITVIRKATEHDKIIQKRMDEAIAEGPHFDLVPIDCSQKGEILEDVFNADQSIRNDTSAYDPQVDNKNLAIVVSLLEKCGMPTLKQVSQKQIDAIWLVIQHSSAKYQKQYLPIFKQAAERGDLDKRNNAMMEDRILMNDEQPQIYGTQVIQRHGSDKYELYKTLEPEYVNQRRKAIGFEPIEEYLLNWNIKFEVKQKNK